MVAPGRITKRFGSPRLIVEFERQIRRSRSVIVGDDHEERGRADPLANEIGDIEQHIDTRPGSSH